MAYKRTSAVKVIIAAKSRDSISPVDDEVVVVAVMRYKKNPSRLLVGRVGGCCVGSRLAPAIAIFLRPEKLQSMLLQLLLDVAALF